MRHAILLLLPMLLFLPLQAQENPIYVSSNGYITVGTWFFYNVTICQENKTILINVTVVDMNSTHVTCLFHNLNSGYLRNLTYNVSYGATFFWMNITLFKKSLLSGNGTRYLVWFMGENETFFWWRVYLEPILIDHKVWLGNYSIIVRHWWYSRKANVTKTAEAEATGLQTLIKWWSPKFLEKKPEEASPEAPEERKDSGYVLVIALVVVLIAAMCFVFKKHITTLWKSIWASTKGLMSEMKLE